MMISSAAAAGAALLTSSVPAFAEPAHSNDLRGTSTQGAGPEPDDKRLPPGESGKDYEPVVTPNGATLPFKIIDGVKVMHLIAEEFEHEFAPGLKARCWGYNGRTPGPTIEVVEGDRVRIYVTNKLPEATAVHWHAILVPNGMDGVAALTQKPIQPGETFKYEFTIRQHGTGMYHPHFDEMTQMGLGMMGMFVIHPRKSQGPKIDRDFAIMLSEWRIDPGTSRPNPNEMTDFNILTMNSKAFPGTAPLVAKVGDRVRIRIGNLGAMDHHPIHLHGYQFKITQTDGGQIEPAGQQPETTVLVAVGTTRTIEFVADEPGDWALHCHMTHHVMNQMGHGLPNMIGVKTGGFDPKVRSLIPSYMTMGTAGMGNMAEMGMTMPENSIPMIGGDGPFGYIDMGGMFTVVKVRKGIANYDDPGWYEHPKGTLAGLASEEELRRDLIDSAQATAATTQAAILYTCTMHPEVVSEKPGNCPKCGMKLVVRK
jgi:FtsP/CotA-like multicopper oxidase with cupredoxin domain